MAHGTVIAYSTATGCGWVESLLFHRSAWLDEGEPVIGMKVRFGTYRGHFARDAAPTPKIEDVEEAR